MFRTIFKYFIFIPGLSWAQPVPLDLSDFVPPSVGSKTDHLDIKISKAYQDNRNPKTCYEAEENADISVLGFFRYQDFLDSEEIEVLSRLYNLIFAETDISVNQLKDKWSRVRPYLREIGIDRCIESHPSTSYPSGHASISQAAADIFSVIFPEKKLYFQSRAMAIANSRVIGGVHHQSDVEAGQRLGHLVAEHMLKNEKWLDLIDQTKQKLKSMKENKGK